LHGGLRLRADIHQAFGQLALVHLFTVDGDVRWRGDAQSDLVAAEADHCYHDIPRNAQGLVGTAAENEHVFSP
jgi:hypothetical protein